MSHSTLRGTTSRDIAEVLLLLIVGIPISLAHSVVIYPIRRLFARETQRFKALKMMRLDALCQALIDHGDLILVTDKKPKATERELQKVASHMSERLAMGALDDYPQLKEIFGYGTFWIYLNGNAVHEREFGIAMGFYSGVIVSTIAALLLL